MRRLSNMVLEAENKENEYDNDSVYNVGNSISINENTGKTNFTFDITENEYIKKYINNDDDEDSK